MARHMIEMLYDRDNQVCVVALWKKRWWWSNKLLKVKHFENWEAAMEFYELAKQRAQEAGNDT